MYINRNNYEDFFLLYADGELRADERKTVENFVAENEDLKVELEMLQATVLPAEEIFFADKSFLYKEIIFDNAMQQQLLLKIDNELNEKDLIMVDELLASDAETNKEYNILLSTKLDASEKIVFENKHLLYKKEKDNVVVFRFARWATAAAIIGFGLFFGIKLVSTNTVIDTTTAASEKPVQENKNAISQTKIDLQNNTVVSTVKDIANQQNVDAKLNKDTENVLATTKEDKLLSKKSATAPKENMIVEHEMIQPKEEIATLNKTKDLPLQKMVNEAKQPEQIAITKTATVEKFKQLIANENIVPLENTYAQAVVNTNTEANENKILYMDEDDVKRSKVGGFFRKIKRVVQRTANLKTGSSLQIAGFEIAAK
jgi:hypothetical protein